MDGTNCRILVIDDEKDLAEPIIEGLAEQGYEAAYAANGSDALRLMDSVWSVIILDLMLPDMSGESVLRFIRQNHPAPSPFVLVLTARTSTPDKLSLFRLGCDDYICKPFSLDELFERVRAVLRRNQTPLTPPLLLNAEQQIELDTRTYTLRRGIKKISLTPKETAILNIFLSQPDAIVHRREILHSVWGLKVEPDTNFIGVHFSNLRRKLTKLGMGESIETIRNSGFRFHIPHGT